MIFKSHSLSSEVSFNHTRLPISVPCSRPNWSYLYRSWDKAIYRSNIANFYSQEVFNSFAISPESLVQ